MLSFADMATESSAVSRVREDCADLAEGKREL
jgi:hypothetical protein